MTTIAYRDGVMAADSGCWNGDACHGWAEKLAKGPDGTLYGVSGDAAGCEGFLQWVRGGCKGDHPKPEKQGDKDSAFIVLIARPGEKLALLTCGGEERYAAPYFAIGAGAPAAFGALFMGATAKLAIKAAKTHGYGAFGKVRTIS